MVFFDSNILPVFFFAAKKPNPRFKPSECIPVLLESFINASIFQAILIYTLKLVQFKSANDEWTKSWVAASSACIWCCGNHQPSRVYGSYNFFFFFFNLNITTNSMHITHDTPNYRLDYTLTDNLIFIIFLNFPDGKKEDHRTCNIIYKSFLLDADACDLTDEGLSPFFYMHTYIIK